MRLRHGLLAAALVAFAFISPAMAAGMFNGYPAAVTPLTGYECIPADSFGPNFPGDTQGVNPATVCVAPGQVTGLALASPLNDYPNIPIGSVAYGSLGTDAVGVAGTVYVASIRLPVNMTASAIGCLNGSTAATDKLIYSLYNATTGKLLANTALAGVLATGTNAFQELPLAANVSLNAGQYFVGWQANGATTKFRSIAASTYINVATGSATGTFATLPTITPPTTFTADKGPICYLEGS